MNLLDRFIRFVAPVHAARRMHAHHAMAVADSLITPGSDRVGIGNWSPRERAVNDVIMPRLSSMRAGSYDLAEHAPIAGAAVATTVTHTVGTGLALQPAINTAILGLTEEEAARWQDALMAEWSMFAETSACDFYGQSNLYALQRLAFRTWLLSGDCIALTPSVARPGTPYRLCLQIIDPARVCNPQRRQDGATLAGGIELIAGGTARRFHIASRHPNSIGGPITWTARDAVGADGRRNVLHLFEPESPEQLRGVPFLNPVVEPLKQLTRYTTAELQAAVISSAFSVFLRMDSEAFQGLFDNSAQQKLITRATSWDGELQAGKIVNLLPGEEPVTANPGRPNTAFDGFVDAIVTQIGARLEIPKEVLLQSYKASYSASRAALLQMWRKIRVFRSQIAELLCQPFYELWIAESVAIGRTPAPGFFSDPLIRAAWSRANWVGDGPGSIDPMKDASAARERIDIGISTIDSESLLYDGVPWRIKHEQRKREVSVRRTDGLITDPPHSGAAPEQDAGEP